MLSSLVLWLVGFVLEAEEEESMFYLYCVPRIILFLHLDVIRSQIELKLKVKTVCMAIMLDHPWQSLYTQYYCTEFSCIPVNRDFRVAVNQVPLYL